MTTEELNQMEGVLTEARRLQDRLRRWSEILTELHHRIDLTINELEQLQWPKGGEE